MAGRWRHGALAWVGSLMVAAAACGSMHASKRMAGADDSRPGLRLASLGSRRPAAYSARMSGAERSQRLAQLAAAAGAAEARGDGWRAGDAWRRYELVRDGGRDPDELIAEGIALSRMVLDLAGQAEHREA